MRTGSAEFKLMFWGAPQDIIGSDTPETTVDPLRKVRDHGIGHSPIELGTITFDRHWGFFLTQAPSPGVPYFDYHGLIRSVESGERNADLGFILRWDDRGNILTTASH